MSAGLTTVVGRPSAIVRPRRRQSRRAAATALYWLTSLLLLLAFLAPFIWIVSSSLKPQAYIFRDVSPLSWRTFLPTSATLSNYSSAFSTEHVGQALVNSAIVSCSQVVLTVLLAVPAAYALTRLRFRGRGLLFTLIFITFMVPADVLILPLFQIASRLHVSNTLPGVFLPFVASPFALFLLRQAFRDIPRELDEAALIDGASHLRIMTSVIVPNVKPALATLSLMTFLFSWNAFLWPLIVIESPSRELIQVAIAINTVPGELPNWGPVFAGAVVAVLPVLILFLFVQRYFIRGFVMSGLKG
jgi:ABC-type glycerol-3-phosphate transport system permease component